MATRKSGKQTPVDMANTNTVSLDLQGFKNIQTVVGLGISEPSTVAPGNSPGKDSYWKPSILRAFAVSFRDCSWSMSRATRLLQPGTLHFVREAWGSFGESWKIIGKMIGIPLRTNTQGHALKNPIKLSPWSSSSLYIWNQAPSCQYIS